MYDEEEVPFSMYGEKEVPFEPGFRKTTYRDHPEDGVETTYIRGFYFVVDGIEYDIEHRSVGVVRPMFELKCE